VFELPCSCVACDAGLDKWWMAVDVVVMDVSRGCLFSAANSQMSAECDSAGAYHEPVSGAYVTDCDKQHVG
jgi:hypothetical protein